MQLAKNPADYTEWTLLELLSAHTSGRLDLKAKFQREQVWSTYQKQCLMDSIITNIPIPTIYLWDVKTDDTNLQIIDGKQRITTILDYFNNKFPMWSDIDNKKYPTEHMLYNNKYFKKGKGPHLDLSTSAQLSSNYKIQVCIVQGTPDEIEDMFLRHNQGTPLVAAEKRKAYRNKTTLVDIIENWVTNHPIFGVSTTSTGKKIPSDTRKRFIDISVTRYADEDALAKVFHLLFAAGSDDPTSTGMFSQTKCNISPSKIIDTYINPKNKLLNTSSPLITEIDQGLTLIQNCLNGNPSLGKGDFITHCLLFIYLKKHFNFNSGDECNVLPSFNSIKKDLADYRKSITPDSTATYPTPTSKISFEEISNYHQSLRSDQPIHMEQRFNTYLKKYLEDLDLQRTDTTRQFSKAQKQILLHSQDRKCAMCKTATITMENDADHIKPHFAGGKTQLTNGQILCDENNCHDNKTKLDKIKYTVK
jgi:hypothetical protein